MAPAGRWLVLCEEKIREKSGLAPHRDLSELRSLSIPGTYQEKITHLGNSLMNLTGLKSLDLSRNSLVSLEGIQYLTALESLSLYYNCISSLAEVLQLHALTELTDVDFRLNPVVKNESDYRLFVVHMLPKLRQLDDRPVRESERKASQLHFALEEPLDSKQSFPAVLRVGRPRPSRATCADPSAKKCLVMDEDDEAVLNLIAECEWDLSNPPGSTSSSQRGREASLPSSQESRHLLSPQSVQYQCGDSIKKGHEKRRSSSRGDGSEERPQNQYCGELPPQCGLHTHFAPHPDSTDIEETTLSQKSSLSAQKVSPAKLYSAPPPGKKAGLEVVLLEALLDLVDRYWGGCKSLHGNEVFRAQARQILSSMQEFTAAQDISAAVSEEISFLTLEKRSLQKLLAEQQQQYSMRMSEVASELSNTRKEMGDLRQHLDKSLEENSSLKALLFSLKKEVKNADTAATLNLQITGLETSVKRLSGEIVGLKQHLEHYDKVWELTQMLQESHSSLVGTNEHLLQELSQARAQHKAEVEQLHWSYKELKKTLGLFPRGGC